MKSAIPIIDTDTHLTEPPDLWSSRLARKWGDKILHVKFNEQAQMDFWYIGDDPVFSAAGSANWGWKGGYLSSPPLFSDAHPAAYDATARLKEMDFNGIQAAVLYPNIGAISMPVYKRLGDPALMIETVRAYNDFLVDWASPAPERFVGMACLPLWDIAECVKEIERVTRMGHKGLVMCGAPQDHGWPFLADRAWDPVWSAAEASGLPISFHCGGGDIFEEIANPARVAVEGLHGNYVRGAVGLFLDNGHQLADLMLSGVLQRYPGLKFAIVESGVGFIPFVLETMDYYFKNIRMDKHRPEFKDVPSAYFKDRIFINHWFEDLDDFYLDRIGADQLLFETDFPHNNCLHGETIREAIDHGISTKPADVQEKILWRNAAKLYKVEMPAH